MAKKKPRKPLARKTPLKRSDKPLKRTPMNKISPKERKKLAGIRDARKAYRDEFPRCVLTGAWGTCIHEITSGTAGRARGIIEPAVWLAVTYHTNSEVFTDKVKWPVQRQLALKAITDPERYDLAKFNECYTHGTVYQEDVDVWLDDIRALIPQRSAA
jgi:hypothetical protein